MLPSGCFSHSLHAHMWWESEEEFVGWVFKNTIICKNLSDSVDFNKNTTQLRDRLGRCPECGFERNSLSFALKLVSLL